MKMAMLIKRIALILAAMVATGLAFAAPASAQATRTWVSGVGDDANPCSRTAPCQTFAGAISKTAAGGEINCLDPGGFGQVTITKSITIRCKHNQESGIIVSGTNALLIAAGPTDSIVLEGLDLDGLVHLPSPGVSGVSFQSGGSLVLRDMNIRGFGSGYGINFRPSGNATLLVDNVIINDSGLASTPTTGGINVAPAAGMTAQVTISNTTVANNLNVGLRIDTTGIVGSKIVATIIDSRFVNDGSAILVKTPAGTGTAAFTLVNSTVSQNASYGIIINGAATTARVGNTTITGNGTGVLLLGGAVLNTYGDNRLNGNTTDGAFTLPAIAKQ